ncbi:Short transient receptor potential channel 2 [Nymphon striatum]|nr:Short transient receptor potential channel 2 [Nymphon striatum]
MSCGKIHEQKPIEEFVLLSPAPLETAVKLARYFYLLSFKEKERSKDLMAAAKHCESMSTDLLSIAASASTAGNLMKSIDAKGTLFLDALIELEQKEVVSHPAVQRYLTEVWMGSLKWGPWKIILLFIAFVFIPPVWIIFSLPLGHRFSHLPIIKFMSYLVSHIFLIVLMTITNVIPPYQIWESTNLLPHWYEWMLLLWLSGILVSELMNPGDRAGLGWIKVIILGLSAIAITLHCIGFLVGIEIRKHILYIRNQLLSLGLLLCFLELLNFLSFHHLFGPWAIIIRDLMKDLLRFLVILSIFLMGFSLNVTAIYQPINPIQKDDPISAVFKQKSPVQSFEMLFFSLFGLVDPDTLPPLHYSPEYSVYIMKTVFGIYMTVTVVVLINLLIAMMSDTYQRIQAESDTEWKFGRAKLIRNMNKTSPTPSPMNLITVVPLYLHGLLKKRNQQGKSFVEYFAEIESVYIYN